MVLSYTELRVFGWLLWCDILVVLKDWRNKLIDASVWPIVLIIIYGSVLTRMGLGEQYSGPFQAVGMLIIMASFSSWGAANVLAADLEGTRSINYELSLPLPYWLIFLKYSLSFAFQAALFNIVSLVIGKILFFHEFDLSQFSVLKFLVMYSVTTIFFGTFAVWGAMLSGSTQRHYQLEVRIAGPLFFTCGGSFPWIVLYKASPMLANLMLLTPWIYAYEGARAAIFGQSYYLNYWFCLGMLLLFTFIWTAMGIYLFKRRLDCV